MVRAIQFKIPNSLCFSTWEFRSLSKQWTYGPTLMPWRYHLYTALPSFLNLSYIYEFIYRRQCQPWHSLKDLETSEGLYVDGISMADFFLFIWIYYRRQCQPWHSFPWHPQGSNWHFYKKPEKGEAPESFWVLDIWETQKSYFRYLESNEIDRISASK